MYIACIEKFIYTCTRMSYGKPMFKEFIATFVIGVSHLSSGLFAFNGYIPTGKIFSPIGLLEFYTNIK